MKLVRNEGLRDDLLIRINNIKKESTKIVMTIPDVQRHGFTIVEFNKLNNKFTTPMETFKYFEDFISESNDFFNGER